MGKTKCAYRILMETPEGRRTLGRPGVDGRIILKRIFKKWEGAWTGFIRLRLKTGGGLLLMNLRASKNAGNFLTSLGPVSLSRRTLLYRVS
jgi:hypothetical protein